MKFKTIGFLVIVLSGLIAWWWTRSTPWDKARRALDHGEPGAAVEVLVESLESKSWSPEREEAMRELLVQGYWMKGAMESADQAMRVLREKFPHNFAAALGLGVLNLLRDRGSFGVDYLEDAKRLDPKDIRPFLVLGQYFSDIREYHKAELNLANGFIRFPNDERLTLLAADLLFNQGRYNEALAKYQPLFVSTPANRDLRIKIARSYLSSGDLEKASEILISLRPSSGTDETIESFLAKVLFFKGKRRESYAILERLYREDNRRIFSGIDWAVSLAAQGRIEESEKILMRIGENLLPLGGGILTPVEGVSFNDLERLQSVRDSAKIQNVYYLRARASLAEFSGRYAEATRFLEHAQNIDNGDFVTLAEMAELARLKNEPEQRLILANRAVKIYKEHPAALLLRAKILIDLRRTPDAIIDAKQVSDSYPHLAFAQALLSRAWMIQKNPSAALSAAENAVQLNPGEPEAQLALAVAKASLGRDQEADRAFRQALDIDTRFAVARHEWGRWLKSKGRIKEATIQFQEAARLEPQVYKNDR